MEHKDTAAPTRQQAFNVAELPITRLTRQWMDAQRKVAALYTPQPVQQAASVAKDLIVGSPRVGTKSPRKPRRISQRKLIKNAKDAGLVPKRVCPDGSVEVGVSDALLAANGHDDQVDEWDDWLEKRNAH